MRGPAGEPATLRAQIDAHIADGRLAEALGALATFAEVATPGSPARRFQLTRLVQIADKGGGGDAAKLCAALTGEFAGDANAWRVAGRSHAARGAERAALRALKRAWRLQPGAGPAADLARLFDRTGRRAMAVRMAEAAVRDGAPSHGMRFIQARDYLLLGKPEAALTALAQLDPPRPDQADRLETLARRAVVERERRGDHDEGRHLAIVGASYVGSTLLGAILGSTPGAAFAGETQLLTERWDSEIGANLAIDFDRDPPTAFHHCRVCGRRCNTFTTEFRAGLLDDPVDVYGQIRRRLACETLVTSDKTADRMRDADPLTRFDMIVLYKRPEAWARSYAFEGQMMINSGAFADLGPPGDWLAAWRNCYVEALNLPAPLTRRVVLDWERFVADPAFHLDRLISRFGLKGSAAVLGAVKPGCFIGGNFIHGLEKTRRPRAITFRPSRAPPLSPELAAEVAADEASEALARRLDRLYQQDFRR